MRSRNWLGSVGILVPLTVSLLIASCDVQKDALALFGNQGLNLLRPARDYIKPGGLIFIQKGGTPDYENPKDPISSDAGNLTDFQAAILEETLNKSTGLGVAFSLAKSVVPSISADFQNDRAVSLKGIDTTGSRLDTDPLDKLIAATNTSKAAASWLGSKDAKSKGKRVFVVQEIYKANSLDLHADDNKKLDLKLGDQSAVVNCQKAGDGSGNSSSGASTGSSQNKQNSSSDNSSSNSSSASTSQKNSANKNGTGKTKANTSQLPGLSNLGVGVAGCMSDDYTLKLQTKNPIPFAVRLAELELSNGTVQRIKSGKVYTGTLGPKTQEISGSLVDQDTPVVQGLPPKPNH
jgi:hypothetical protein